MKRIVFWIALLNAVFLFSLAFSQDTTEVADSTTQMDTSAVDSAVNLQIVPLLGDRSDGSRSNPVHLIPIYTEQGDVILPDDELVLPFSTKKTCSANCHRYETISRGWHFNALDSTVNPGRPGEPWILTDAGTGTEIPLSYRRWPGTFRPDQLGISPWQFTQLFGSHTPGGGAGEVDSKKPEEIIRSFVSGKLEINCLSCHDADPAHDQAEYATQVSRQNFRWAAASTAGFASVTGSAKSMDDMYDPFMPNIIDNPTIIPPSITYRKDTFDHKHRVFFNIKREAPPERCYYCHSTLDLDDGEGEKWEEEVDVHIASGMKCVDCHRNGTDHNIVRGYEGEDRVSNNPLASALTCEGCHLGVDKGGKPQAGRFGAPVPEHKGIPLVHFEKLSCTACHSGPWPDDKPHRIKTAMAHKLGTHGVIKTDEVLPHIYAPIFAKESNGKIAPHKLIWPSYWGDMSDDGVKPLNPKLVWPFINAIFQPDTTLDTVKIARVDSTAETMVIGVSETSPDTLIAVVQRIVQPDSANLIKISWREWPDFTDDLITQVLKELGESGKTAGTPVYVTGGKLHYLSETGKLVKKKHPAGDAYLWPMAHNVRPASQSLGVRGCSDCHSTSSNFLFASVGYDTPVASERGQHVSMASFHKLGTVVPWLFSLSFIFRPWLKLVLVVLAFILFAVLILYTFKGIDYIIKSLAKDNK